MYPQSFSYLRAESVEDAVDALSHYGDEARVLAGGMSLVPMMKYRQRTPAVVVDIGRLRDLAGIAVNGELQIGATTRHHEAAEWSAPGSLALISDVGGRIGDRQVRSMGTVGGGIAAVEPAGDWGPALIALRGEVVAESTAGTRVIGADELFVDIHRSALRADELITALRAPVPHGRAGSAQAKFELRVGAALMSCAACLTLDQRDRVVTMSIGCGGLEPMPVRLTEVEAVLQGEDLNGGLLEQAGEAVREADRGFRRAVAGRLVRDAVRLAAERAGASMAGDKEGAR